MKKISLVVATTLPLLGSPLLADDKGEHESLELYDLPPAVQRTVQKEAACAKIEEIHRETGKNGEVIYDVEIMKDGTKETEIKVNASGQVVERETDHEKGEQQEQGKQQQGNK
jgi:hypothetical protein